MSTRDTHEATIHLAHLDPASLTTAATAAREAAEAIPGTLAYVRRDGPMPLAVAALVAVGILTAAATAALSLYALLWASRGILGVR